MSYADAWEIFIINHAGQKYAKVFYFVRGIWHVNSGITKITKEDDIYLIYGVSGSCYACAASRYGIPDNQKEGVYNQILADERAEFLKDQEWENFDVLLPQDS